MEELLIVCDQCGEEFQPNSPDWVAGLESSAEFLKILHEHQNRHHRGEEEGQFAGWTVIQEGEL